MAASRVRRTSTTSSGLFALLVLIDLWLSSIKWSLSLYKHLIREVGCGVVGSHLSQPHPFTRDLHNLTSWCVASTLAQTLKVSEFDLTVFQTFWYLFYVCTEEILEHIKYRTR